VELGIDHGLQGLLDLLLGWHLGHCGKRGVDGPGLRRLLYLPIMQA
jgi:hypothetical protein